MWIKTSNGGLVNLSLALSVGCEPHEFKDRVVVVFARFPGAKIILFEGTPSSCDTYLGILCEAMCARDYSSSDPEK